MNFNKKKSLKSSKINKKNLKILFFYFSNLISPLTNRENFNQIAFEEGNVAKSGSKKSPDILLIIMVNVFY